MRQERVSFAVDVDGELLVCTDGHVGGFPSTVEDVKRNSWAKLPVMLTPDGPLVVADLNGKPENVLAALMSVNPERTRILEAPDSVIALLPYEEELV